MSGELVDHRERSLTGARVELAPLRLLHVPALAAVGLDARVWRYMTREVHDEEQLAVYVQEAIQWRDEGTALPFATVDRDSGKVIGTTRFADVSMAHLRAEIGWTWLAPDYWRTGRNLEAKLLMLTFGFEELGLRRIEFKTDAENERSRTAILGLGASFEGIFRKHMVRPDGGVRNTAYYSITDNEWPRVQEALTARIRP